MIDLSKVHLENLDPDEKTVFMWQYNMYDEHDFHWNLWQALKTADDSNLRHLGLGFPVEVQGLMRYRMWSGWWDEVERKAMLPLKETVGT